MDEEKKSLVERLFRGLDKFLILGVIITFVEVLLEVGFRYVLNKPLTWGGELSQTVLVWLTFVGAASVLLQGGHIAIDMLVPLIPSDKAKRLLRLVGSLAILIFVTVGFWAGWQVVARTWSMRTTAMQIPSGILYLAFPVGCLLTIPVALRDIYRAVKGAESR
ncbi:MAG TPA: hypothetical protein DIC53_02880 [Synergistaceae bacterium]|nr:hypothetical protein [Synergistaceae bacterium]